MDPVDTPTPLDIKKCTYKDFFECLSGRTQTSQIARGCLLEESDTNCDDEEEDLDSGHVSV